MWESGRCFRLQFLQIIWPKEATERAKSLESQISLNYDKKRDVKKIVASQAAQKACRIFHHKSNTTKMDQSSNKYQNRSPILNSFHMMIEIIRIIKSIAVYEPLIEQYFQ